VIQQVLRVAWYRFRATLGNRWGGYLSLVLLVGLVGGIAMGAVAAARRTQSSFTTYLASTNPSDLNVVSGLYNPAAGSNRGYDPNIVHRIAHLPHVKHAESIVGLNVAIVGKNGAAVSTGIAVLYGSVDGEYFNQDRVTLTQGQMANPRRADEAVLGATPGGRLPAKGVVIHGGAYTNAQVYDPAYGTPSVQPHVRLGLKVIGVVKFNDTVVQDDVDATQSVRALFTPALTRPLLTCCVGYTITYVQLDHGSKDEPAVEAEIERVLPKGVPPFFQDTPTFEAKTQLAIKPESIALGVFGGIATLAALLIAGLVIGRQLRAGADEQSTLRALGAGPATTSCDALIGIGGAVVVGSFLAGVVAVVLSPLAPIGPARPFDPSPGVAFDWTVLGLGVVVLIFGLSTLAVALAVRRAPHRLAQRQYDGGRGSRVARVAATSGLPVPAVAGMRFALESGAGPSAVPVRSAILGAALAVTAVVATLTFGSSLGSLVSHPALYGWNWNYELVSVGLGSSDIPEQPAAQLLSHDRDVAGWAGVYFAELQIDGRTEPVLGGSPNAPVQPPTLSGHGFEGRNQVVLGATTLAELHKRVGDTVTVSNGVTAPTHLQIVGTATMPTVGVASALHSTMGTGALLSYELIPPPARNSFGSPVAGPNAIFVRLRASVNPTVALRTLKRIAADPNMSADGSVLVLPVQRPAEIVNYHSMGATPALLGTGLAAGAAVGLGLTLIASVRRRRRDLALLKTLGFTQRQLAAVIAWQSTIAVATGTVVGVPLGIILGRSLWDLFARNVHVVPHPSVPTLLIVLIAIVGLVLANIVAAVPGRIAARTPTALLLRAE
jgi:hypothetical protein